MSSSKKIKTEVKRKRTISSTKSEKQKPKIVTLITDEEKLHEIKTELRNYPELQNEINTKNLIIAIKSLNDTNPHNNILTVQEKYISLNLVKKIKELLDNHRFFYFYFLHYKTEEKHIMKIIPSLRLKLKMM